MDKCDVEFPSTVSEHSSCLCDCCHGTGKVVKLRVPGTYYYDGRYLSTRYHSLWVCRECAGKLIEALKKLTEAKDDARA